MREQEINEIKNETKRELNMLDDEISKIIEKLDVNLTNLELRCRFCENSHNFEKERELRLKEEVENNKDKLLDHFIDGEANITKL